MHNRYYVGQADDEGVMIIDSYEDYEKARIAKDAYNRRTFIFAGQEDPSVYHYDVFYVEEEDDLSEE